MSSEYQLQEKKKQKANSEVKNHLWLRLQFPVSPSQQGRLYGLIAAVV